MKALVKTQKGPGSIEVQERPVPSLPHDDWVLIRVKAAGVCGTDLHIWHDQFTYWPPVILGHEFSGEIVEIGTAVTRFQTGDRVVAEPHALACGVCELCRQGHIQICPDKRSPGWGIDGAFAEYVTMPARLLHRIPDNVSDELAALAEPMAIVVHQVLERGRVESQDVVVITGAGPVGILAAFAAKSAGAALVVMTGLNSGKHLRFGIAREMGVDHIVNVDEESPVERVRELTGGKGADLVVETSGAAQAIKQAIQMVKKRGRISAIGISAKETVEVPWNLAMSKVIDVRFNMSSSFTSWDRALSLIAHARVDLGRLITHKTGLEEWERVFHDLEAEKGVKAIFLPGFQSGSQAPEL